MKKNFNQPFGGGYRKAQPSRSQAVGAQSIPGVRMSRQAPKQEGFKDFAASELFCAKCQTAQPVREKQLLYLPDGDLFDYRCAVCGSVVGTRRT